MNLFTPGPRGRGRGGGKEREKREGKGTRYRPTLLITCSRPGILKGEKKKGGGREKKKEKEGKGPNGLDCRLSLPF